tara:strand:- start:16349 stop:16657 length:309 start_codon:yes stop_codon:yes gene_type:complete
MTTHIIKLDNTFNLHDVDIELKRIFETNTDIIFVFDIINANILDWRLLLSIIPMLKKYNREIIESLTKSIIVAPYKWQHLILNAFFFIYPPIKPYEIVHTFN